jgi:potassium/hydrogen antiporter
MSFSIEHVLLIGSLLMFASVLAGKTSYRTGIPILILFVVIGMLAGSEGIGKIPFDNPKAAQFIGILALNVILFAGGLETDWRSVKPIVWQGVSLSTLGVVITTGAVGVFVWLVTDFSLTEGLLLGAIISSTDAAAVFSILRSKNIALKGNIRPLLELESGSNDPMAYFLTIALTGLVGHPDKSFWGILPMFLQQISIGLALGFAFGYVGKWLVNKINLIHEGLYPVLMITWMYLAFSTTSTIGGNGFLAVYLAGIYLGNNELIHKKTIIKMFDGLAWLMQIILFLTLGLLVFPSNVLPVIGIGLAIAVFQILVARPLSVFISLWPFRMRRRNRWFTSWVGLRGAVPIVFATYPLIAGLEKAEMIFNIVFFVSIVSVLIQGTTMVPVAKWLHVSLPQQVKAVHPSDLILAEGPRYEKIDVVIPAGSTVAGSKIVDLKFPKQALIILIQRGDQYLAPNGSTVLQEGDILSIVTTNKDVLTESCRLLQ